MLSLSQVIDLQQWRWSSPVCFSPLAFYTIGHFYNNSNLQ